MKRPAFLTYDNKIRWFSTKSFDKRLSVGRLHIAITANAGDGAMGRLGGGWDGKLGMMWSRNEVAFEVIFFRVRFSMMTQKVKLR